MSIGGFEIYLYNALVFTTWAAYLVNVIAKKIPKLTLKNRFIRLLLYFLLGMALLIPFSGELDMLTHFKSFFFNTFLTFSLSIIGWQIYFKVSDIVLVDKILFFVTLVITIYGIYCYVTTTNPYITAIDAVFQGYRETLSRIAEERGGLVGRIQGTMNHAITWGGACCILFYYFLRNNSSIHFLSKSILLGLLSINVVLSGSRSALLFLIIGIMVFFLFSKFKQKIRILQYGLALFLIIVVAIYQVPTLNKYSGILESTIFFWDTSLAAKNNVGGSSLTMRAHQLEGALEMISGYHMFAGLGHGYIGYYFNTYGDHPVLHGFESIVFMALVNSGIMGLFLWLLLFYSLLSLVRWLEKKLNSKGLFNIVLLKAYIISYFVFTVFTGFMNTQLLFFIILMFIMKSIVLNTNDKPSVSTNKK